MTLPTDLLGWLAMLEETTLLLIPQDGQWMIRSSMLGPEIGSVRPLGARSVWLRWWSQPRFHVHEHEDEPLLFVMRAAWWPGRWYVEDADGRPVGVLRRDRFWDRHHRPLGRVEPHSVGGERVVVSEAGEELATWEWEANGLRVCFDSEILVSPFTKMLILAAALVSLRAARKPSSTD